MKECPLPKNLPLLKFRASQYSNVTLSVRKSLKAVVHCEWKFTDHSELHFILKVPELIHLLSILYICAALSQINMEKETGQ